MDGGSKHDSVVLDTASIGYVFFTFEAELAADGYVPLLLLQGASAAAIAEGYATVVYFHTVNRQQSISPSHAFIRHSPRSVALTSSPTLVLFSPRSFFPPIACFFTYVRSLRRFRVLVFR